MMSTNINYVTTYFEYPTLTKIHGEASYESLKEIKNQQKENSSSVTSDLGGGTNGHLGLIYMAAKYMLVCEVLYVVPVRPGVLDIQVGTTQHEAINRREDQKLNLRLFRESIDVQ